MLRFALDDQMNSTAPAVAYNRPTGWVDLFHQKGMMPPLWAILNDQPDPGDPDVERLRRSGAPVPLLAENATATPSGRATIRFEEIDHTGLAGPETCKDHYAPGSWERQACELFGSGKWSDCVRACLYPFVPEAWHRGHADRAELEAWALMHMPCWLDCAVTEPAR